MGLTSIRIPRNRIKPCFLPFSNPENPHRILKTDRQLLISQLSVSEPDWPGIEAICGQSRN